jgi:pullulanase
MVSDAGDTAVKEHPAFRMADWQSVHDHASASAVDNSLVTMLIDGAAMGDSWSRIMIIANSGANRTMTLPAGSWRVAAEQSSASAGNERVVSGTFVAEGTAVSVLHQ